MGKAAGDALGPYGAIARRYALPPANVLPASSGTTYQPYAVEQSTVAAFGRNNRTGLQVWSAAHGYPGDAVYREFHKRDGDSGLHYWRVTGPDVDLGDKQTWWPADAFGRAGDHARHFGSLVRSLLADYQAESGRSGIVVAAYDTELFGHWWFEGVDWLAGVLADLAAEGSVDLTTAGRYIAAQPPSEALALPESSWGQGGNHFTWLNADTRWIWPVIHRVEATMEEVADRWANAPAGERPVLQQIAREALLLQASDWPFLITTGQARDYATERFTHHVERFDRLVALLGAPERLEEARHVAEELFEIDNVYPDIDVGAFRRRESGSAAGGVAG